MLIPSEGELCQKILHPDAQRSFDKNPAPGKALSLYYRGWNQAHEKFDMRLEIRHPWFSVTFTQAGVFREVSA